MAQITEIIMTAYEKLQKLIADGDIYTKSQLDEKLDEVESKFGTEVAKTLQDKINDGSLGALTIGDGTITTKKIVDGAITSNKLKCGTGVILETNAITIDFATGFVILDRKINIYYELSDNERIINLPTTIGRTLVATVTPVAGGVANIMSITPTTITAKMSGTDTKNCFIFIKALKPTT